MTIENSLLAVKEFDIANAQMSFWTLKRKKIGGFSAKSVNISDEIKEKILGAGEQIIDYRPANDIAPQMESLRKSLDEKGFPGLSVEDLLTYASFPEIALAFFEKNRK